MTEVAVLLWAVAVMALGVVFGSWVSALSWRRGHTVGTGLAQAVVRAVVRVLRARPSRTVTGAAVGACDSLLLTGTLLALALLFEPTRGLLFDAEFRLASLVALGLLALAAGGFSLFAWILLNASVSRFLEALVGFGCLVALGTVAATALKWALPWAYGVGAGVLALLLVYVVFPPKPPVQEREESAELPENAILQFKRPLPPDERIKP